MRWRSGGVADFLRTARTSDGLPGPWQTTAAEAFNSLFKAELVRNRGPWKSIDDLEIAVAAYIDWADFRRLHGEIGLIPPVEYEDLHRSNTPTEQPAQRQLPVLSTVPSGPIRRYPPPQKAEKAVGPGM